MLNHNYAHMIDWYVYKRDAEMDLAWADIMGMSYYWCRAEYQKRGLRHIHGLFKAGEKDLTKLARKALRGHVSKQCYKIIYIANLFGEILSIKDT